MDFRLHQSNKFLSQGFTLSGRRVTGVHQLLVTKSQGCQFKDGISNRGERGLSDGRITTQRSMRWMSDRYAFRNRVPIQIQIALDLNKRILEDALAP